MHVSVENHYWDSGRGPRLMTLVVALHDLEELLDELEDQRFRVNRNDLLRRLHAAAADAGNSDGDCLRELGAIAGLAEGEDEDEQEPDDHADLSLMDEAKEVRKDVEVGVEEHWEEPSP